MYFRPLRLFKVFAILLCLIIIIYSLIFSMRKTVINNKKEMKINKLLKIEKDFEEISEKLEPFIVRLPNFPD